MALVKPGCNAISLKYEHTPSLCYLLQVKMEEPFSIFSLNSNRRISKLGTPLAIDGMGNRKLSERGRSTTRECRGVGGTGNTTARIWLMISPLFRNPVSYNPPNPYTVYKDL
ncbi:hypothetical protein HAX54_043747 [Datura stramonium]|uniref:Uncharacterized protein n=1 Tax=Datura stramonium TaxID=4076 RepID=A0ABS8W5Z1_DATST|nr:hypothetical protein [Datura stramonium]